MSDLLWQAKLHARLHDPAEKALVLLRDPAGHESGTVRTLHEWLFPQGVSSQVRAAVRRADWWASAADRPQFPRERDDGPYVPWAQVNFAREPVLIGALNGAAFDLQQQGGLKDTDVQTVKEKSLSHFRRLLDAVSAGRDQRKAALVLWRFGPELVEDDEPEADGVEDKEGQKKKVRLGQLWRMLPADTRVPDHSIWEHLDLVAAFAGAFIADPKGQCALLSLSIGPVQDFIAAARTTSDLWAGSHLLSYMAWEAMRLVCAELGPEAILFPRLRGVPLVDLWLIKDCGLPRELFDGQAWTRGTTDANPLFSAALPNRFVAVVPAAQAEALARRIEAHLRTWVIEQADEAFRRVLEKAGSTPDPRMRGFRQIREQLADFPEVHWAVVPYDALVAEGKDGLDVSRLAQAMAPFFPGAPEQRGFLGSRAWSVLRRPLELEGNAKFYVPNPGVLYPAVHALTDRVLAAAKSVRPFSALAQHGYRCSLTGEAEWLSDELDWEGKEKTDLGLPPGERKEKQTLWIRLAQAQPSWAREGEHLGALATLKRLWPTLFLERLRQDLGDEGTFSRFVVSTHAMALVTSLTKVDLARLESDPEFETLRKALDQVEPVALPRKLALELTREEKDRLARIPSWLDAARDKGEECYEEAEELLKKLLGGTRPETYYALLLMDGDRMGAWLSGGEGTTIRYRDSFHPRLRQAIEQRFGGHDDLRKYLEEHRAVSPARHMAISSALNDFSLFIARDVVEEEHMGRVLYAGGDDLLAMFAASDLLPAMRRLRHAYAGMALAGEESTPSGMRFRNGFVWRKGRLHLTMGERATTSAGAVIAHHQAPLSAVLRELRAAEQRAKRHRCPWTGRDRDAFSLSLIKRSGGVVRFTSRWFSQGENDVILHLLEMVAALSAEGVSRRAAYNTFDWLANLPEPSEVGGEEPFRQMLEAMLAYQFARQGMKEPAPHARQLARLCPARCANEAAEYIKGFLAVAEFLSRDVRSAS